MASLGGKFKMEVLNAVAPFQLAGRSYSSVFRIQKGTFETAFANHPSCQSANQFVQPTETHMETEARTNSLGGKKGENGKKDGAESGRREEVFSRRMYDFVQHEPVQNEIRM